MTSRLEWFCKQYWCQSWPAVYLGPAPILLEPGQMDPGLPSATIPISGNSSLWLGVPMPTLSYTFKGAASVLYQTQFWSRRSCPVSGRQLIAGGFSCNNLVHLSTCSDEWIPCKWGSCTAWWGLIASSRSISSVKGAEQLEGPNF